MKEWVDIIEQKIHEVSFGFWDEKQELYHYSLDDGSCLYTELEDMFRDLMPEKGQWDIQCSDVCFLEDAKESGSISVAWLGLGGVLRHLVFNWND